jgi:MYXO-CTERM domain-containing protein
MNTPNEDQKPSDNMEMLKQQAATCGPGCGCHATRTPGKTRWVIGAIVLAAAGVMVVQAMIKSNGPSSQSSAPAFAALAASPTPAGESGSATNSGAAVPAAKTSVGTSIGALAELNDVATNTDAVFIFLPGKEGASGNLPSTPMKGAARIIESKGLKCGLFTLKASSADYDQIAGKISLPGVLAMVKGRGMSSISGDITEAKLVQGFVAASSAGGCGPSAGAGCCPK